ncbi:MAG: OmpA family protein [Bacteroidales bacterium]|jgi:peptidoglycan-associated lipoprotein|nr:OmpA family protein [Bacteroidales bacterium]
MKHIITISMLAVLLMAPGAEMQAAKKKVTGKQLFDKREYASAITTYEQELKNKKITRLTQAQTEAQIGICYYYLNKPRDAASWLRKGISKQYETADVYAHYGLTLQKLERYDEAKEAFENCLKKDRRYANIQQYIAQCDYALAHAEPNAQVRMRSAKVNTDGSEYGVSPAGNEIFFSRAPTKGKDIDPRTGLGFTEIYSAKLEYGELVNPKKEKAFMKIYHNTGIFSYDTATNYMYMTVCDPKSGKCGIYRSKYDRKKWGEPEALFVNSKYDIAHPMLGNKGQRLYFTSNAQGGKGKTDIWYVDKTDDIWGEPVNAGDKINTTGREEFPFVEGDSLLYFASTGHEGFGGLDIFAVSIEHDGSFGERINLGRPFNSGADDFNLITYGEAGALVSSRNPTRSDDIYTFNKAELPSPNRKEKPKPEPVKEPEPVKPEPVKTEPTPEPAQPPAPVPPKGEVIATIYFDFDKFIPQTQYRKQYEQIVALMKAYPSATFEIAGYADTRGGTSFNKELSDKRAQYIAKRLMDRGISKEQIVPKGYGFSKPAVPGAVTETDYAKNRRVEIRVLY